MTTYLVFKGTGTSLDDNPIEVGYGYGGLGVSFSLSDVKGAEVKESEIKDLQSKVKEAKNQGKAGTPFAAQVLTVSTYEDEKTAIQGVTGQGIFNRSERDDDTRFTLVHVGIEQANVSLSMQLPTGSELISSHLKVDRSGSISEEPEVYGGRGQVLQGDQKQAHKDLIEAVNAASSIDLTTG